MTTESAYESAYRVRRQLNAALVALLETNLVGLVVRLGDGQIQLRLIEPATRELITALEQATVQAREAVQAAIAEAWWWRTHNKRDELTIALDLLLAALRGTL